MLRVTVELIDANDGHREVLGEITLENDGTGDQDIGNYNLNVWSRGQRGRFFAYHQRAIERHDRTLGFWPLIHRAVATCITLEKKRAPRP